MNMNERRNNMDQIFYGFLDLDIGDFFYHTRLKFYGIKVSRYMFFDINLRYLSRLDPKYITNEKIYLKRDCKDIKVK